MSTVLAWALRAVGVVAALAGIWRLVEEAIDVGVRYSTRPTRYLP